MAASLEELREVLARVEARFPCTAMGTVLRAQYQQLANEHRDSAQHAQHISAFQATAQRILSGTRARPCHHHHQQRRGPHRRAPSPTTPPSSSPSLSPPEKTVAAPAASTVREKEGAGRRKQAGGKGEGSPSAPRACRSASLNVVLACGEDAAAETSAVTAARKAFSLNSVVDMEEIERPQEHQQDDDEAAAAAATATTATATETETDAEDRDDAPAQRKPQCVVCLDGEPMHAFVPCGHVVLCNQCAAQYPVAAGCPVCRAEATALIKVYFQ